MADSGSRFGTNLFFQFVLATALGFVGWAVGGPMGAMLVSTGRLLYAVFSFGVLYGFFRLFGVRGGALEQFYQNFPIGLYSMESAATASRRPGSSSPVGGAPFGDPMAAQSSRPNSYYQETTVVASRASSSFDWDDLFSVKYLRYMGLLLILSAAFSMLFRLEWNTTQKLIASTIAALSCIAGAEFYKNRHSQGVAAGLFLPGFACLQFSLTLAYVLLEQGNSDLLSPGAWLAVKLLVTAAALPLLTRYSADFADPIYFLIAFVSPLSLLTIGGAAHDGGIAPLTLFIFLLALSMVACGWAVMRERIDVMVVTLLAAFVLAVTVIKPLELRAHGAEAFGFSLAFFLLHILSATLLHQGSSQRWANLLAAHAVITHALAGSAAATAQQWVPAIDGYTGITLIGMALISFGAHLLLRSRGVMTSYTEALCQLAMAVSAVGIFVQVEGTWTAIAFLIYSCVTLWLSIHYASKVTRIYAFLMLTASVFKLYATSSELFDSVSGSTMILVIGVVLMGLATRLERLKRSEAEQGPEEPVAQS